MAKIESIEGIGEAFGVKLRAVGINTVAALLKVCATPKGRADIVEKTGIRHDLILEWTNHADLYRINGVAEEYSDLLEEAGVDTVPELAQRNAENLYKKMVETNAAKKLVRKMPTQNQVAAWIEQARELPRVVTY